MPSSCENYNIERSSGYNVKGIKQDSEQCNTQTIV